LIIKIGPKSMLHTSRGDKNRSRNIYTIYSKDETLKV